MATERDIFLAILSLDAYNRGYNVGMDVGGGTKFGNASIVSQDFTEAQQAAVFYAVAYTLADGTTVISYRGTDDPLTPSSAVIPANTKRYPA